MAARAGGVCWIGLFCAVSLPFAAHAALAAQVGRGQDHAPGQVLVRLRERLSDEARRRVWAAHGLNHIVSLPALGVDLLASPNRPSDGVPAELAASSAVEWAEPNYLCRPALAEPNDPAYHEMIAGRWVQWPAHQLDMMAAWDSYPADYLTASNRPQTGPIVAIVDTGVDPGHPDFMNVGATGTDVAQGGQLLLSQACTFLSGQSNDLAPEATDEHGHGTYLAGLVAAAANNGITAGDGIAGIAYTARLLPLKVARANGVAMHADVARAIIYAADQGAMVILIGMEAETWSQTLQSAVDYAWNRGCFLAAPAGNTSDSTPIFPASCPHVFGVAAATADGRVAAYSTRGRAALAGPGGDETIGIYSTLPTYACTLRSDLTTPAYGWLMGTSQAAAHVAGAAALRAGSVGLAPATGDEGGLIWQALQQSATALTDTALGGWEETAGYGLLAPATLLTGEGRRAASVGGIVGRVLSAGSPVIGAPVTATPEGPGQPVTVTTEWPAGGYRMANAAPGRYQVTAEAGGNTGVWERANVRAGCDAPGVDFRLGSLSSDAALLEAEIPTAARCASQMPMRVSFANTGASTWTRSQGYQLVQVASDHPLCEDPDHVNLSPAVEVAPGASAAFDSDLPTPGAWGFYTTAWRLSQQGGVGWFGPVVSGTISVTSFLDIAADHWAVAAIEAAHQAGVVQGYGGDLYHPEWPVSRDQMAVYISRALAGGDAHVPAGPAAASFTDVPSEHWAYRYVEYAVGHGVVEGYDSTHYRPELVVDRGQMAVFVARAQAWVKIGDDMTTAPELFSDVPAGFWAGTAIKACVDHAVVQGYLDGLYHPGDTVTRDQMAVYVARAFELAM